MRGDLSDARRQPACLLGCRAVKIGKAMGLEVTVLSTSESKR